MNTKLSDFFTEIQAPDIQIINADVYAGLCSIQNATIDCAVTSPPYFDQRDYGFEGQIGNEKHYGEYIAKLEAVFGILKTKLSEKGVFFLNVGDKYLGKYGNSPLGMIPYKLAYFMHKEGFMLVDTLIWHKPNHMPSSIKNRFTNTYEPVFVFAKQEDNFFSNYMKNNPGTPNHFSIHLQATPYSHIAVYPEKLVEKLLSFGFPRESVVLDPFGGSGTTAKAVQNLNSRGCNHKTILIEASEDYVKVIKERCNISQMQKVQKLPFSKYEIKKYDVSSLDYFDTYTSSIDVKHDNYVEIFEDSPQLRQFLNQMRSFAMDFRNDGICYLGIKKWTIEDIIEISKLNESGWIIRNKIVIGGDDGRWYPVFLVVKDTKRVKYKFNLDAIRESHKDTTEKSWDAIDFVGMKVNDNLTKNSRSGVIVQINSVYPNFLPREVIVSWGQNVFTKEMVQHGGALKCNYTLHCPKCSARVSRLPFDKNEVHCSNCTILLWESKETLPVIKTENNVKHEMVDHDPKTKIKVKSYVKTNYDGKFKDTEKKNYGASPGARSSTQDMTFTLKRAFAIDQEIIGTIFKKILKGEKMSTKTITERFPQDYKHTVGHWFRSDMGGSCPAPEDLERLSNHIMIPPELTEILNTRCLSLQAVKKSHKGKNPGDYFVSSSMIRLLSQTTQLNLEG